MNQQLSNPTGNLHVAFMRLGEIATKKYIEPRLNVPIWDHVKPLAVRALLGVGIPDQSLTPLQIFDRLFPTRKHRRARCTR